MTTRKGFKRLVRDRMARTGERYAAARRALTAGEPGRTSAVTATAQRTRLHPNTSSIATVLAAQGVVSPIDGRPLSEALIHGIGGGVGAGYILWEFKAFASAYLTLGFTNRWQYPTADGWFGRTLGRLGVTLDAHETGGARAAREALDGILEAGRPAIAFVEHQALGTWGAPPELSGFTGYPVVVIARAVDGGYLVDDRGEQPLLVSDAVMAAARARIGSWKHRLFDLRPVRDPSPDELQRAVVDGLADQVEHLSSTSDSFGLPAWRKWARLMTDTRNAKAWSRVFADGTGLFGTLLSIVEGVDGGIGPWGGHMRDLQAQFLDEAADLLDRPALREAATSWRAVADLWEDLADAAVPDDLAGAAEAVEADEALHDAVMAGEPGRVAARDAAGVVWAARARYARSFPSSADRRAELFADLGRRLHEIHAAEVAAFDATRLATVR